MYNFCRLWFIIDVADFVRIQCDNPRIQFSNIKERTIIGNHKDYM